MSPRERRMLMVLGGVAVVALAFFLLTRGGGEDPDVDVAPPPVAQPDPEPTVSPTPRVPPLAIFGGRDPFFPLILPAATTGDGAVSPPPPPPPPPPGNGVSPGPTVSPAPPPDGNGDGGTNVGGRNVRLLDVFTRDGRELVQVEVDGVVYTVGEGETFAENFRVLSIDGRCATFLFGDEQFTLCEPGVRK